MAIAPRGGGFVVIDLQVQNHKGTFGFSFTGPVPQGSLSYVDHLAGVKVQSVAVTSFVVSVDGNITVNVLFLQS